MTKKEFLMQLQKALQGNLPENMVQENVAYYSQYIMEETAGGKAEEVVLNMLGDPWILARTIIDANDGTDRETVNKAAGERNYSSKHYQTRGMDSFVSERGVWWKKLLALLAVVMVLLLVAAIISGVVNLLAPIVVPVLIIFFVVRLIDGRRS